MVAGKTNTNAAPGEPVVAFVRQQVRQGPVALSTKIYQAIGMVPGALKEFAFRTLLLLYYNQVMGLSASAVSLVMTVALVTAWL